MQVSTHRKEQRSDEVIKLICAICKKELRCKNEENAKKRGWKRYEGDWEKYKGQWLCDKCEITETDGIESPTSFTPFVFPYLESFKRKKGVKEGRIKKKRKLLTKEQHRRDFFSSGGITRKRRK